MLLLLLLLLLLGGQGGHGWVRCLHSTWH
jgi:hypothetical protein